MSLVEYQAISPDMVLRIGKRGRGGTNSGLESRRPHWSFFGSLFLGNLASANANEAYNAVARKAIHIETMQVGFSPVRTASRRIND